MRNQNDTLPPRTIDEYLTGLPENVVSALESLRQTIRSVVPGVEELISYQVPSFRYKYMLVGFAAFRDHCSFFVMSRAVTKAFQEELNPFKTAAATIHFTPERPLPEALVVEIVKARLKENEMRAEKRKQGKFEKD